MDSVRSLLLFVRRAYVRLEFVCGLHANSAEESNFFVNALSDEMRIDIAGRLIGSNESQCGRCYFIFFFSIRGVLKELT